MESFPSIFIWYFILRWWEKHIRTKSKCFVQSLQFGNLMWLVVALEWWNMVYYYILQLYKTCLLMMFFFSPQNKTISILDCVNINIIFTMHSWNMWNIPLYKHREKVQAINLEMEILNRYQLLDHSITDTSCLFFHKITFWPLLLLQLNWVQ